MTAVLSPCGRYRYHLARSAGVGEGTAVFLMLNPSTADATQDDPTIRKCLGFAKRWGMAGIQVVNLFAYRATDPRDLLHVLDDERVGPENDDWIRRTTELPGAKVVVAAWGANGDLWPERVRRVVRLVEKPLHAIRVTKSGQPWHPLMASYADGLKPWRPA